MTTTTTTTHQTPSSLSSAALDVRTFAELVHQTRYTLLELARSRSPKSERAEDIVQDALLAAYTGTTPGSDLGRLAARLRQLVIERCQRELRPSPLEIAHAGVHLPLAQQAPASLDEALLAGDGELPLEQELVALALESLPSRFRKPLELRYVEGLSLSATGRELRMKEGVLRKRLAASLRHLKRALAVLVEEGVPASARLAC